MNRSQSEAAIGVDTAHMFRVSANPVVDKKHRFLEFRNRLGVVLNHLSLQELVVVPVVSSVAATVRIFDIGQGDVTGVPLVFAAVKHFRLCTVKPNRPPPTHIKTL